MMFKLAFAGRCAAAPAAVETASGDEGGPEDFQKILSSRCARTLVWTVEGSTAYKLHAAALVMSGLMHMHYWLLARMGDRGSKWGRNVAVPLLDLQHPTFSPSVVVRQYLHVPWCIIH